MDKSLREPNIANSMVSWAILSFLHLISELGLQISLIYFVANLNTGVYLPGASEVILFYFTSRYGNH